MFLPAMAAPAQGQPAAPLDYLTGMLKDAKTANPTLAALRSTEDLELAPVFEAMTRSGEKNRRLFGVVALGKLLGKGAATALLERLNDDPVMAIRAEAMAQLIRAEAISAEQLSAALKMPDESIRCQAACALADMGQGEAAAAALTELTASKDRLISGLSCACLLGLGQAKYEQNLQKLVDDPTTPPAAIAAVLRQLEKRKALDAVGFVLNLAASEAALTNVRVQAYKVAATISSRGPTAVRDAIAGSDQMAFRIRLLNVLGSREDAWPHLKILSKGDKPTAVLARFELARQVGGPAAGQAAATAIDLEHPIAVAYVLERVGKDIEADGAKCDYYVPPLVEFIRSVDPRPANVGREHYLASAAAAALLDLNTPASLAALKALLGGRVNAITRSTTAGLLRAKNRAACDLVRPLLASPYQEVSIDAALALGHFADAGAAPKLKEVLARPTGHPPALVVLSAWYLLRIAGQAKTAAEQLAEIID